MHIIVEENSKVGWYYVVKATEEKLDILFLPPHTSELVTNS